MRPLPSLLALLAVATTPAAAECLALAGSAGLCALSQEEDGTGYAYDHVAIVHDEAAAGAASTAGRAWVGEWRYEDGTSSGEGTLLAVQRSAAVGGLVAAQAHLGVGQQAYRSPGFAYEHSGALLHLQVLSPAGHHLYGAAVGQTSWPEGCSTSAEVALGLLGAGHGAGCPARVPPLPPL